MDDNCPPRDRARGRSRMLTHETGGSNHPPPVGAPFQTEQVETVASTEGSEGTSSSSDAFAMYRETSSTPWTQDHGTFGQRRHLLSRTWRGNH